MNLIIESMGRPIEADFSKTVVAHARNSVILAEAIGADIITGDKDMHLATGKQYKNIICCYASPYMKYKKLIQIVRDNPQAKLWWFVNDHDLEDNILLRNVLKETDGKRKFSMICNNTREGYRGWIRRKKMKDSHGDYMGILDDFIEDWFTLNLNAMIVSYSHPYQWEDKLNESTLFGRPVYESVYYGTMRKWRLPDFLEYQQADITFSATPRTQRKLIEAGCVDYHYVDKLTWQRQREALRRYKFSLYIEDEHTHTNYAHMANRYYESLMFNVITIFDIKCMETIRQSGFDICSRFIVSGAEEYIERVADLSSKEDFELALRDNEYNLSIAKQEHDEVIIKLKDLLV